MGCHLLRPKDQFSTTVSRFRRVAYFWASFGTALGLCWAVLGLAKGGVGARWRLPWPPFCAPGVSLAYFGSRLAPLGLLFGDCLVLCGACLRAQGGCQGLLIRKNCKIDAPHHWRIHGKRYLVNVPSVEGVPWICGVSTG